MPPESIVVGWTELRELSAVQLAWVSEDEKRRSDYFKAVHRREQFLCGRALLRVVLERYTSRPASSHQLKADNNGKPICLGGPAVSIAHSGRIAVCAVSDCSNIGVDVDVPGRRRDVSGIAKNFFAEEEAVWLATQPEDRFYMLWVLKEAWLKAKGTGIAGGLDRLQCRVTPPDIEARVSGNESPALFLISINDALVGLATTAPSVPDITLCHWEPSSMRFNTNDGAQLIASTERFT